MNCNIQKLEIMGLFIYFFGLEGRFPSLRFLHYYAMILYRIGIIVGIAVFELGPCPRSKFLYLSPLI